MRRSILLVLLAVLATSCEKKGPVEKTELARVVSLLGKSASSRAAAEERLVQTSPYVSWGVLAALIEKADGDPEARAAAIRIVSKTQGDLGLPGAVVRAAHDPHPTVRAEAIRAVVERADPDLARALNDAARETTDAAVRADLEKAVADVKARERDWYKRRVLNSTVTADDRAMAARWLSEVGKEEDVPTLITAAAKFPAEQLLQQEVILTLSHIGGAEAKRFILSTLGSDDPFMRGISAFAETRLRDPEAVPKLGILLAEEQVGDTRVSAANALGAIATDDAKAELAKSCKIGHPDKRVELACADAQKMKPK